MTQATDLNDVKVTLAEQVVVLRETKHLVANLGMKVDALAEKVIVIPAEVARIAERQHDLEGVSASHEARLKAIEDWRTAQEGAASALATLWKNLPALGAIVLATVAVVIVFLRMTGRLP